VFKFFKNKIIKFLYKSIELIEWFEYRNISLDQDDISKKIINSIKLMNVKVKTDTGYHPVSDIHITQPYINYIVRTKDFELSCADNHIVFDDNMNEIFVKDLKIGSLIQTESGIQKVKSIGIENYKLSMFDLTVDHPNHRFYTNGILSHNTVSSAIFILHTILFNNDKNVMIVANKGDTAVEIVDKVKSIYSLLPFFLKPGVKTWNQKSLTFDNGCRIKTSARTKTPAIGFTIDLLYLDEFAHIPSNIIEPYYTAAFPTVSAVQNSKIIITSTPNGMNLFHKLLTDAERPDGDSQKNNYKPMRVYWYQVPGRFVTYIRLNAHKMHEYGVTADEIHDLCKEKFGDITKVFMKFNVDIQKDVINIFNNNKCTDEMVKSLQFIDKNGYETSILSIGELTTWKDEAVKDIGGEDAFNQEYGLRFINGSKSLLNESLIEDLLKGKRHYEFQELDEFKKLRFSYQDLKWIDDEDAYIPIRRKEYKIVMSVDISEGLGQDYSIINIFKVNEKPTELIEDQKFKYNSITDFFRLEQIAIFRNNFVSVKQLSELLYLIAFEYFNPENVRIVLELNNYGNTLLAEMPHVFDGNNQYGSSIFVRYKHRIDSNEEKVGLKVGDNKNMMVKDYQDLMQNKGIIVTNEDNIREITTFVKHVTTSGNIRYAADVGHDDCLLPNTLVKTIDGYKKIKDIQLGELVLTHLGNYKPVTNICVKDFDGDMYNLKFRGQIGLDITYNHPIYEAKNDNSMANRKNYNNYLKREWTLPGDLRKTSRCVVLNDKICDKKDEYITYTELFERPNTSAESNFKLKEIKIDSNFSKFLGLFLADGNCYKPDPTSYRVSISFNIKQTDLINEICDIVSNWGLNYSTSTRKNCLVLTFYNRFIYEILIKCYDEYKEKIFPHFLYNKFNSDNMGLILDYWIKGDGWLSKRKNIASHYIGCSTSMQLALTMRDIAISTGKHSTISLNKRNRYGKKCKDQYWVSIYNRNDISKSSLRKISDFEYSSVLDKKECYNYKGVTYNLEVQDDNSYVANGLVVHNCVMTLVNMTSIFRKNEFKEMVEEYGNKNKSFMDYINKCMNESEFIEGVDYGQVLRARKQFINRSRPNNYSAGNNWFNK
jgi:hypothetical protein